jgi:ribosomal protein L30/L7E
MRQSRSAAVGRREPRVGDVRIVQIKSKIGATRVKRESLQSLRLSRIGRSSEVDVARPVVRGQIHSVRHLTEIRPLTATGQFWAAVKRPDRVLIEDPVPYTVRDHQAVCVPLSDGARFI